MRNYQEITNFLLTVPFNYDLQSISTNLATIFGGCVSHIWLPRYCNYHVFKDVSWKFRYKLKLPLESFNKSTFTSSPRTFQRKIIPSSQRALFLFLGNCCQSVWWKHEFYSKFRRSFCLLKDARYGGKVGTE